MAHDYDSDGDLDVTLGSPGGTTVIENYASQTYCHDNGVLSTTLNRCSCFTGFSGAQCSNYCPGVVAGGAENICYGHGACRTTGASEGVCLCAAGYGGIDSLNRRCVESGSFIAFMSWTTAGRFFSLATR